MDRDTELTVYLLRYLLENRYFRSKEEMAETFDVSKRQIQRLMNVPERTKGGTIALSKILNYFGTRRIPLDPVLSGYMGISAQNTVILEHIPAYLHIHLHCSTELDEAGHDALQYSCQFIGVLSRYICPYCQTWCNPWSDTASLENRTCLVAQTARALIASIESECR